MGPSLDPHVARRFKGDSDMADQDLFDLLGEGLDAEIERSAIFQDWTVDKEPA